MLNRKIYFADIAYWILLVLFSFLILRYQIRLLDYFEWSDESETIVAAKMMAAGDSLYSQIFNIHGPLVFLPGMLLEKLSHFQIRGHRVFILILQWAALAAIYFSPVMKNRMVKLLYSVFSASIMLIYFSEIFGHTYIYQVIAGLILLIILSQYAIPIIFCPDQVGKKRIALGNILLASLPFLAMTYIPAALLIWLGCIRREYLTNTLFYSLLGFLFNLLFLIFFGSIAGYFALHIYLNLNVISQYTQDKLSSWQFMTAFFYGASSDLIRFIIFCISTIALTVLATSEKKLPWRVILLWLGFFSLLIRGSGFQGLPYLYASLALPIVFFREIKTLQLKSAILLCLLIIFFLIKLSLIVPMDKNRLNSKKIPENTEYALLVKKLTNQDDRIIAYSFQNHQYIFADRLPASGNYFYFPWQEEYNNNPRYGIKLDACQDIKNNKPKLMLIDKMNINGEYPWESYAQCIQKIIDRDYSQLLGKHYYIRNDLVTSDLAIEVKSGDM